MKVDKLPSARLSRKTGRLDGREGLPELQADQPHSPFLQELATIGEQHFAKTTEQLNNAIKNLAIDQSKGKARKTELNQSKVDIEKEIKKAEETSEVLDAEYLGSENQSAASKVTDRRYLPGYFYYPIIFVTIIGELVITYPAFETIFADIPLFAVLTTFAASAMTVSYAYVLGITLKRKDDRKRLLQRWVLPTVLGASIFFVSLVASLSHLRARNFSAVESSSTAIEGGSSGSILPGTVGEETNNGLIPQDASGSSSTVVENYDSALSYEWAFFLFFSLQMALIAVATLGEYFHYSLLEVERKRNTKALKKLRRKRETLLGRIEQIESQLASAEKDRQQLRFQFSAEISNIKKKVEARAQAFWGSNIRQRADSPNARSRRFGPPEMKPPDWVDPE